MSTAPQQDAAALYQMIYDGTDIELKWRSRDRDAMVRKVRKMPIFEMSKLGSAWGKELKEVACYLDLPEEDCKALTDECFEAVLEEGRKLNFTSFQKWFRRQTQTLEAVGRSEQVTGLVDKVVDRLAEQAAKL